MLPRSDIPCHTTCMSRPQAVNEKIELQKQFDALLSEKQEMERQLIEAGAERLKAAKALIDLQIEDQAQTNAAEERVIELEGALQVHSLSCHSAGPQRARLQTPSTRRQQPSFFMLVSSCLSLHACLFMLVSSCSCMLR